MSKIKSTIYWIILVIIVLGYAFFFTSKFLFHEEKSILYTEMQTEQPLSNEVSLILQKWIYSPNERAMMVMFSAKNDSLQNLDLNWSTAERHNNTLLNLETEIIYPFENIVVVNIADVPEDFEEISLSLQLDSEDVANPVVQFYTNKNLVETVEKIGTYTDIDYRIEYLKIQKSDTVKFLFKVFLNGIKTAAWIILIILAAVGMMCLIYPETRTEFFKIISEIFTGTKNLILG